MCTDNRARKSLPIHGDPEAHGGTDRLGHFSACVYRWPRPRITTCLLRTSTRSFWTMWRTALCATPATASTTSPRPSTRRRSCSGETGTCIWRVRYCCLACQTNALFSLCSLSTKAASPVARSSMCMCWLLILSPQPPRAHVTGTRICWRRKTAGGGSTTTGSLGSCLLYTSDAADD